MDVSQLADFFFLPEGLSLLKYITVFLELQ